MIRYEESKRKGEREGELASLSIRGRKRAKRGKISEFRSPEGHQRVILRYSIKGTRQDQVLLRHAKSHVTSRKRTLLVIYNSVDRGG